MSLAERHLTASPEPTPRQQVGAVWWALGAVLLALSFLFLAYGWRAYDFTAKRSQTQSQSRAELTRSQVLNAFRHMDDILIQTKSIYERAGPGIASQAGMLAQSSAPLGHAPYTCIGMVNAMGDTFFRFPENCLLPDATALTNRFQPMGSAAGRLLTDAIEGHQGLEVVRAVPLYYADETFAGMVMAVLSTDYVFSVFDRLAPGTHDISLEMTNQAAPALIARIGLSTPAERIGTSRSVLDFEGFSGPARLVITSSVSRSLAVEEWVESVFWPFLGFLVVMAGLVQGARVLTRALRQQLASDLVAQRARVENEVQSRFIANISHEVRTPMNGVLGAARLLGKTPLSESQQQLLGLVERSGKVLLGTINDLLDVGKLREGQMRLEQQPVNLVELLEDSCALQAPQAFAKGLALVVKIDLPEHLDVVGDALRMQQVISNLLSNAVKFTAEGMVSLTVSLRRTSTATHLNVEVADTGMGIDLTQAHWLFQPFQQADASTARRFGGTGLGLAITHQLVHLMGGALEVGSELGVGSTFTARWPLTLRAVESQDKPVRTGPVQTDPVQTQNWPAGMLIDLDFPDSLAGQRECLAMKCQLGHLGIRAVARQDRLNLQSASTAEAPEVVVMDETCALLKRPEWLELHVKFIILSREPGLFSLPDSLQKLNFQVLAKPPRRAAVCQALQHLLTVPSRVTNLAFDDQNKETVSALTNAKSLQGVHVLVAEDHPVNQILIGHLLKAAGCHVDIVSDGDQAIHALFHAESIHEKPFDIVLMDCQMPKLDGFSATKEIRQRQGSHRHAKRIPVIAMTALAMPDDMQRCLDSGMDDYCTKPIDELDLIAKIAKWTQQNTPPTSDRGSA